MQRGTLLVFGVLFIATGTFGQASSPSTSTAGDSQTLKSILQEIRQLRQELHAAAATSERAQILFYRIQGEQAAVARAQKRLDDARAELEKAQKVRVGYESEVKFESEQDTEERTPDPARRKEIEGSLPRMKDELAAAQAAEQQAQSKEMEAKDQLQIEQGKLDGLQEELDRLDKVLENLAKQP
ncbi:MAG TPA: hypothetical protein VGT03_07140 [Candidatus Acidoferrales bacterium]|nr:hypothetical protein [Candidatus Acidoferrales bacterium]